MPTLYLIEQNTVLRKTGDRLLLCSKPPRGKKGGPPRADEILREFPCGDIDHVMLFGNIQITTQALQELLHHGIETALFSYSGVLLGQLTPPHGKNIPLRIAQFQKHGDSAFCLRLAKALVHNKIANALAMLRQHRKNHPDCFNDDELQTLQDRLAQVEHATALDTLLGYEGAATAAYFKLFGKMLNPPWTFTTRTRRPPKDPVNAVLSFGYVVVGAELQALLDGLGLDPYLGFYHSIEYGRPGLALDLLEEFRHALVDRLALNLFNLGVLAQTDFAPQAEGGIYLGDAGKKKFFVQYERMLGELVAADAAPNKPIGFRALFQQQVHALMRALQDQGDYVPFRLAV